MGVAIGTPPPTNHLVSLSLCILSVTLVPNVPLQLLGHKKLSFLSSIFIHVCLFICLASITCKGLLDRARQILRHVSNFK